MRKKQMWCTFLVERFQGAQGYWVKRCHTVWCALKLSGSRAESHCSCASPRKPSGQHTLSKILLLPTPLKQYYLGPCRPVLCATTYLYCWVESYCGGHGYLTEATFGGKVIRSSSRRRQPTSSETVYTRDGVDVILADHRHLLPRPKVARTMASPTDDQIPIGNPALLRLLGDLEALPPSIKELRVDLTGHEFGGFFTPLEGSYRRQVRLRVVTAIGNCRSLQVIDLNPQCSPSVCSVTEAEATALFQGLQSNPVLKWLGVSGWQGCGTAAACRALAVLVRSSRTLIALNLASTGLTGEGLGHIAAALQANTSSMLRGLYVNGSRIGDAAGAQHLADILASTPTLEVLGMLDISMDAAGGEVIAKALARNTSLRWLGIGWQGRAANPTNQSAALARIVATLSAPVAAGASDASAFNTHIKQLYLFVSGDGYGLEPIEAGVGEAVAHMLRSNTTLKNLEISTSFMGHGLEALRYNTSITDLAVDQGLHRTTVDVDKLIKIVHSCQTLRRVQYNPDPPPGFKRQVFRSLKDNPSIKTLVIDGWKGLDDDMFKDLMQSLQVNTNLEKISLEATSWKMEGKEATLQKALRGNKRPKVARTMASPTDDQIPPALLRLLADLEALPPSIEELKVDLTRDEFGGFFTSNSLEGSSRRQGGFFHFLGFFTSLEGSYRRQVRLRVLTAIGNCRSLQVIDLNPHFSSSVSSVTEAEAMALFQGLQCNPVLHFLSVSGWQGFGTAASCEALVVLVRSSRTLIALDLTSTGLTGEGLGHIAAALQANTSSILQGLYVNGNRIGDAAGEQHLVDILASTPTLEILGMHDISMDAAGGEVIAKALAHNTSLTCLGMGWQGRATNPTNQSAALTRIVVALSAPVAAGAPASAFNMHIKTLKLTVWRDDLEPIEAGMGEAVAQMLRSNASLEKLHITTSFVGHGLEALRHNTSITQLRVEHGLHRTKVDLDKLIPIIQSCQTLQRLQYANYNDPPPEFQRRVFRSLKDNPSIKTLVIDGWGGLDDDMFKDLMESLQVNTNLEKISLEGTSWKMEGKEATLQEALRGNKRLEVARTMASTTDDQIPPALLRLIADLEALPPSLKELAVDLTGDKFGGFFTSLEGSYRRQVRLHVLTAIGNCRSLRYITLNPHEKFSVCNGTEAEATALFQGLQSNPVLYGLEVSGWQGFGTAAACEALAGLVRSSCTLKILRLEYTGLTGEGLGHLAAALQASTSSILETLFVNGARIGDVAGAQHLADILTSTPTLDSLGMFDISMDAAGGEVIAKALAHNTSLRHLAMGQIAMGYTGSAHATNLTLLSAALTRIVAALSAPVGAGAPDADAPSAFNTHVKELLLAWENGIEPIEAGLGEAVAHMLRSNVTLEQLGISTSFVGHGLEALRYNPNITELLVIHTPTMKVDLDKLIPIIQSCQTLQSVQYNSALPPGFQRQVFRSLKDNPSIKTFVIDGWEDLDDDMFKDLMESLQVNTNLEKISLEATSWKREGKEATLQQALRGNKRQVAYVKLLHQQGDLKPTNPKAGRLFLCGSPLAGKTTLRNSMIRLWSTSPLQPAGCGKFCGGLALDHLPWVGSKSTQGIEIQMLRDDEKMQVSIWDLAGQDKFRGLQSILFPSISQACVFFFVFSLYDRTTHKLKRMKDLDDEFVHWLRFVASNWGKDSHVLPQVFVILTHLDKMPLGTDEAEMVAWAMPTITQAKERFRGLVEISDDVFALKASSPTGTVPLLDSVFELFENLLSEKLRLVPGPCTRMSTVLAQWKLQHSSWPLMRLQTFHDLCFQEVKELQKFPEQDEAASNILEAIASYLHDVGTIMFFKISGIVVVDPDWVSHIFLGSLIKYEPGQHGHSSGMISSSADGFVTKPTLQATLRRFLKGKKHQGFEEKDLIALMLELKLCYEEEVPGALGVIRYFVPHTLDDANGDALNGMRQLVWPLPLQNLEANFIHVGRRLQCNDQLQTYLDPAFFPRFQVTLRDRLFLKRPEMQAQHYTNQLNLISFHIDGMEVLIEIPGDVDQDFIDILVRSRKTPEQTRAFILAHVVDEMRSFCASTDGSRGVELVEGIIRPECVKRLTLCVHRRGQAVLKQDLIQRLLGKEIMNNDCGGIFTPSDSEDYYHTWDQVAEAGLDGDSERADGLLDPEDLLEALNKNERIVQQQLISVEEAAKVVLAMDKDHLEKSPPTYGHTMSDIGLRHRALPIFHQLRQDTLEIKHVLDRMEGKLDVLKSLQEEVLLKLDALKLLQERTLVTVVSKMDEIMNFSAELVKSELPRRPYFTTQDVGMVEKLVASIYMSKAVTLHFMCEDTRGNHGVKGQVGLGLMVEDANWKWIQPIAVNSVRMLVFLAKAGLHVAAGIGSAIPNFAEWSGAVPFTAAVRVGEAVLDNINLQVVGSSLEQSKCVEEAWACLKEELKPQLVAGQMGTLFQLFKVQFVGGPQRGVGWVCQECMVSGRQQGTLHSL